jgi:DNA-binding MarR family transcriptional regulator
MDQSHEPSLAFARLASVVREVRREYPRMELGQLQILLIILASPAVRMTDLRIPTELTRSAISRTVQALSDTSYLLGAGGDRRDGLGLVEVAVDPFDARSRIVHATPKGSALGRRLLLLVEGAL